MQPAGNADKTEVPVACICSACADRQTDRQYLTAQLSCSESLDRAIWLKQQRSTLMSFCLFLAGMTYMTKHRESQLATLIADLLASDRYSVCCS